MTGKKRKTNVFTMKMAPELRTELRLEARRRGVTAIATTIKLLLRERLDEIKINPSRERSVLDALMEIAKGRADQGTAHSPPGKKQGGS